MSGNNAHLKSISFDFRTPDHQNPILIDKEIAKSFSFAIRTRNDFDNDDEGTSETTPCRSRVEEDSNVVVAVVNRELSLEQLSEEIRLLTVSLLDKNGETCEIALDGVVAEFLEKLESKIGEYEDSFVAFGNNAEGDASFIEAVTRLSCLVGELEPSTTTPVVNRASSVIYRAMMLMEEELRRLLEETADSNKNQQQEVGGDQVGYCLLPDKKSKIESEPEPEPEPESESTVITFPTFSAECLTNIRRITAAMITSGYQFECCNVFTITRRHAFEIELKKQGFEKHSADDIQKMSWETLQTEIEIWIRSFNHISCHLLVGERNFYHSVFSDNQITGDLLFTDLSSAVVLLLVNFVDAVSMTKRSTEKLFKFLDMYEALTQSISGDQTICSDKEILSELSISMGRLGEAAVSIFCMLENSIKSDVAKTPVPSGAVHPLTRYTMNYLKYACEYKHTLEQIFRKHLKTDDYDDNDNTEPIEKQSPFAVQLTLVMDLLEANLDAKSKLYKDPSLRYIFQMNNGRYRLQKVKETPEIRQILGDKWCREKSSELRQCHKGYQRESWTRVLQCLNPEGLQVNGKIYKPTLKERFKQFNQLFEEIHKTQTTWVVSDEQLQSELRVSITAVMIPAYRSFVSRFGQIFTSGRQTVKYIKYQPDDIEGAIEELFDGNPNSMARRRA